ncbi:MAG TPA: hypothetical protein VIV12_29535 [Streptosporangiaceae bacterium]
MSAPTVPTSPAGRGLAVVGVHTVYERVGVLVRARPAEPHPASGLLAPPVMVTRTGSEAAGWVTSAVTAVRLASMAARSLGYAPRVAVRRPVAGGNWSWAALVTGALLADIDAAALVLVGGRQLTAAIVQREAAANQASPPPDPRDRRSYDEWWRSQAWRRGYPAELLGPQEQAGRGVRQVLRLAWDVAGAAGLRLAAQGGAVA